MEFLYNYFIPLQFSLLYIYFWFTFDEFSTDLDGFSWGVQHVLKELSSCSSHWSYNCIERLSKWWNGHNCLNGPCNSHDFPSIEIATIKFFVLFARYYLISLNSLLLKMDWKVLKILLNGSVLGIDLFKVLIKNKM